MQLSIVDLAAVPADGGAGDALATSVALARQAERLGYHRYWVAEHHGMGDAIVSSNPEVLITRIASATDTIRVGSGAVLLNIASPFKVAETYALLDALFPGRIDLGLGRAGGAAEVDHALQVERGASASGPNGTDAGSAIGFDPLKGLTDWMAHEEKVAEVVAWIDRSFARGHPFSAIQTAVATGGSAPQPWLLGSSMTSAVLAGVLGLPYCFAAFFNPAGAVVALRAYRSSFRPAASPGAMSEPHSMLAVNAVCADTAADADRLRASAELFHRHLAGNSFRPRPLIDPQAAIDELGAVPPPTRLGPGSWPALLSGAPDHLHAMLTEMVDATEADELMVQDLIPFAADRHRSYELLAGAFIDRGERHLVRPHASPAVPAGADTAGSR